MDAVIGVETGNKVIWIKPYKKAPLRALRKAYQKHNYDILSVFRTYYNSKVLSKSVDYVISCMATDLNGQKVIKTVFALAGDQHIILSDTICCHNGIDGNVGSSEMELKKYLCDQYGIDKKNIRVDRVEHIF